MTPHSPPTRVHVALAERAYDIEIGPGLLAHAGAFFASRLPIGHVVVITDQNVEKTHARAVLESLDAAGARVDLIVLEPGEETKSVSDAEQLWQILLESGADRRTVVAAVGGGVVGDLAGFVAATYARGLDFMQIPTTLLAQVDSSVGGKVGVNLPGAKNMIGAFWQPRGVLIDTETIHTLPAREYRAGLAEVVKYGVILDAEFFAYLEDHLGSLRDRRPEVLRHIITRSCQMKAGVVTADERETTGLRAILNYGHTFCHALEAVTSYGRFLHGEAVAIGMHAAARLAHRLGRVDAPFVARQAALLQALELPILTPPDLDRQALVEAMARDKKSVQGKLRFILPSQLGHVELVDGIDANQARQAFDDLP